MNLLTLPSASETRSDEMREQDEEQEAVGGVYVSQVSPALALAVLYSHYHSNN